MRQSSQGVNTSCVSSLPPGKKYVAVQLLTKETLYCTVETKGRVQHVFDQICSYLGLKDAELFGLALLMDGEYLFLDVNIKLSKLASRTWKSQSNSGLDSLGRPLLTLNLRIQFYVDCPLLLQDKQTRHHYYLQLKSNFLQHCRTCSEEQCFLLAAYAMQADLGNYHHHHHHYARRDRRYFEPSEYFPSWILGRLGEEYVTQHVPSIHKDYSGFSRGEAEMAFIREASVADAPHNLHVYKLKKKKNDLLGTIWLGVCSRGVEIYENCGVNSPTRRLESMFVWADIGKLCFEKKKFEIRAVTYASTKKYTYYTGSDDKSKHLLYLCRATHQFNLAMQPRVQELKMVESKEIKSYRESYIYSDTSDLEWEQEHRPGVMSLHEFNTLSKKVKVASDQRTSVISNASSTTTSGIVSDRVQSVDGSEDEMELVPETDSPQSTQHSLEAVNVVLQSTLSGGVDQISDGDDRSVQNESTQFGRPVADTSLPPHADVADSSSERSASTVRSRLSLVNNSQSEVGVAASDTCSSLEHSYTSSLDSTSAKLVPPPAPEADRSSRENDMKDWPILNSAAETTLVHENSSQKHTVLDENRSALLLHEDAGLPPYPMAASGCAMPMTCAGLKGGNRLQPKNFYGPVPHPVPHRRTKIGVSSLARHLNAASMSAQQRLWHLPSSSSASQGLHVDSMTPWWQQQQLPQYRNLALSRKSVSVPNVIGENDCLPPCAAATFPPTHAYRNVCNSSGDSLPLSLQLIATPSLSMPRVTRHNCHWCCAPKLSPDEAELHDVTTIAPPSDFAYIPPPPAYQNVPDDGDDFPRTLPPPRDFRQGGGGSSSAVTTSAAIPPPRGSPAKNSLCVKAKSEDNILLNGNLGLHFVPGSAGFVMTHYGPQVSLKLSGKGAIGSGLHRSVSSVTNREELLDFQKLRERSQHLDLPLINALCNDRSLLRLPEGCGHHRHPAITTDSRRLSYCTPLKTTTRDGRPLSWHMDSGYSAIDLGGLVQVPRATNNGYLKGGSTVGSVPFPPGLLNQWPSSLFGSKMMSESVVNGGGGGGPKTVPVGLTSRLGMLSGQR